MKNPYEILGVRQGATKDEVRNAYNLLEKKYYAAKKQGSTAASISDEDFKEIEKAYCKLMGYPYFEKMKDDTPGKTYKFFGITLEQKKLENFFHYYKVHLIVGLFVILALTISIRECANRVNPDLNIGIVGTNALKESQEAAFKQDIINHISGIKDILIERAQIGGENPNDMEATMAEKVVLMLYTGGYDVMLVDKELYKSYSDVGAFESLDSFYDGFGLDKNKNSDLKMTIPDLDANEHYYGIYIDDLPKVKQFEINPTNKVLVLTIKAEHKETGRKFIEYMLSK
jgi:hypothetical protein